MFPDYATPYYSIGPQRIDNKKLVHAVACMDEEPVRYSNLTRAVGSRYFHWSCIRQSRVRISASLGSRFAVQNGAELRVTFLCLLFVA